MRIAQRSLRRTARSSSSAEPCRDTVPSSHVVSMEPCRSRPQRRDGKTALAWCLAPCAHGRPSRPVCHVARHQPAHQLMPGDRVDLPVCGASARGGLRDREWSSRSMFAVPRRTPCQESTNSADRGPLPGRRGNRADPPKVAQQACSGCRAELLDCDRCRTRGVMPQADSEARMISDAVMDVACSATARSNQGSA